MDAALRGAAARVAQRRHSSFADTVETILDELEGALPPATVFLGLLEDGEGSLRILDARGTAVPELRRGDELWPGAEGAVPDPEPLEELGVQSFIAFPLETSESHRVGSLCAAGAETGLFDQDHLDLLSILARMLAREIEVVRSRAELQRLSLEVNLSGRSIGDPELPRVVEAELEATGIDASRLVLEITETAAIADMDQAHVKIDGEFVRNLASAPADALVVKAMVQIASGLGLRTIAEFVEPRAPSGC